MSVVPDCCDVDFDSYPGHRLVYNHDLELVERPEGVQVRRAVAGDGHAAGRLPRERRARVVAGALGQLGRPGPLDEHHVEVDPGDPDSGAIPSHPGDLQTLCLMAPRGHHTN